MDSIYCSLEKEYFFGQINALSEENDYCKNFYKKAAFRVKVEELNEWDVGLDGSFDIKRNHFIKVSKYFKTKSSNELKFLFFNELKENNKKIDYSKVYSITPLTYQSIYGDYSCKFLENFIEEVSEKYQKTRIESCELIKEFLKIELKPCFFVFRQKPLNLDFLCQVCFVYCCSAHPIQSLKSPIIQLYSEISPLNLYSNN